MKITYKSLSPSITWVITSLILGFIIVLQSCKPTQEVSPMERNQDLLTQAKRIYKTSVANARSARLNTIDSNPRDIDVSLLFPDWDVNGIKQNSKAQDVLGVLLKKTEKEYWEADFVFADKKALMIFKKYTLKDSCLTIYDKYGKFLEKGRYFANTKLYTRFITRASLSKQARIAASEPGMIDGGELPEVIVKSTKEEDHSNDGAPGEAEGGESEDDNPFDLPESDPNWYVPAEPIPAYNPRNSYSASTNPYEQTTKEIKNDFSNPCYTSALNSLLSNESFLQNEAISQIMQNFNKAPENVLYINFGNAPDPNLEKDANTLPSDAAFTAFTITLNDLVLANASQEYIAATIAHEVLHAYIDNNIAPGSGLKISELEKIGHEEMSTKYINPLATMLNKLYQIPEEEAIALAWGGLGETKAWQEMLAEDNKNNTGVTGKIVEINKQYLNFNNSYGKKAKGTKCK